MNINPLDKPGTMFEIELLNPNPSSRRTKDGPVRRISFEVSKEVYEAFMDARESNLRLIGRLAVAPDTDEQPAHDAVSGKKKERKPKEPTPHGALWRELFIRGFWQCPGVREAIQQMREAFPEAPERQLMRELFCAESLAREVGPERIAAAFPPNEYPAVKSMVEQALRKAA